MKALAVVNMLPSPANPRSGTFVEQQIRGLEAVGLDIDVVLLDRPNRGMGEYLKTRRLVRRQLAAESYDVVHIMYGGFLAYLATMETADLPTVVSFCGVDLLGANYGSVVFRIRTGLGVAASVRAAKRADAIIAKSQNLKDGLPADVDRSGVFVIPNGISLERFRPMSREECRRRLGWRPEKFHILFSTSDRNNQKKRLPLAEKAVEALSNRGIVTEIHGLSRIPHDTVPIWLNAADVVLMTSTSDEGSPNIIKEALACNRPVVSFDVGDVSERIAGVDGCYISPESTEALADRLERVQTGPGFVESRAKMESLSLEVVARRVIDVYDFAVRRRRAGRG